MNDTHRQTTNFLALISDKAIEKLSNEEREDPVKMQIIGLMYALKFDFNERFMKQFKNLSDVTMYKQKLYSDLAGVRINAIYGGYNAFKADILKKEYKDIGQANIVAYIKDFNEKLRREEENKKEAERVSSLLPPIITCDPVKILADAKKRQSGISSENFEAMLQNHNALLILNSHLIRKPLFNEEHRCLFSGCRNLGTLSRSTTGGGIFYCSEHFKLT